jgi:hypothetical protein
MDNKRNDESLNLKENFYVSCGNSTFNIAATKRSVGSTEQTELDSHADTSVAGANFRILFETGEYASVHTFSNEKNTV